MKRPLVYMIVAFIVLTVIGCADSGVDSRLSAQRETYESEQQATEATRLQDIADEFKKFASAFTEDINDMTAEMDKYRKITDIDQGISVINEYVIGLNLRRNHLEDFYAFILNNEVDLKSMKVDTYEFKKSIKDFHTADQLVLSKMKQDIESYIERQKQLQVLQREEEQRYIDLLVRISSLLA